ncbi:PREDICTED: protein SPEAR1 isoform X3 [Nelumbo nucifera]|uniref:Protein SPEAR1 isoform X3 n=1 Tax=Nelumbo nucifera TaxID=4432 RepID=A0A1U8Q2S3_NELNU|nr:PREDICTED: protein SPEAR1 isoform X3 [Nelumbo nucifera]
MDGSYFGEPSLGHGRSGSSRKGKKSNSDKPRQPQRGLGVAQLEKIRLYNQMGSSYFPSFHSPCYTNLNQLEEDVRMGTTYSSIPSSSSFLSYSQSSSSSLVFHPNMTQLGLGEMETIETRYGDSDSQYGTMARWNHSSGSFETQDTMQPSLTRHLLSLNVEDSVQKKRRKDRCGSMGSSSQNSDSSDTREVDLELKLSL